MSKQAENEPLDESDLDESWIRKKPDFKWKLENPDSTSIKDQELSFDIESKRLGVSREYNRKYVGNGILRFLTLEHRYGNQVSDGAMIGYIQAMTPDCILKEVNIALSTIPNRKIPNIKFPKPNPKQKTKHTCRSKPHHFNRDIFPENFCLHHLWVDLCSAKY